MTKDRSARPGRFERWLALPTRTAQQWKDAARLLWVTLWIQLVALVVFLAITWFMDFFTERPMPVTGVVVFGLIVPTTSLMALDARRSYWAALQREQAIQTSTTGSSQRA